MNLVLTADWHLRDDCPSCRADSDWYATQMFNVSWVVNLANKNNATLCIAGDIFHRPQVSEKLVLDTYEELDRLKHRPIMIAGNHDLPNHMLSRMNESSYGILAALLRNSHLDDEGHGWVGNKADHSDVHYIGFNWRYNFEGELCDTKSYDLALCHLTIVSDIPIAAEKTVEPEKVFKWLPHTKLIVAGDIHRTQCHKKRDRMLLVPGCLNIQVSDMADYKPVVHLLADGILQPVEVPQTGVKFIEKTELKVQPKNTIAENIGKIGKQSVLALFYENLKAANPKPAQKEFINKIHFNLKGDYIWQ